MANHLFEAVIGTIIFISNSLQVALYLCIYYLKN